MDPLSALVALIRPQTVFSKTVYAAGRWAVRPPRVGNAGFGVVLKGNCELRIDGGPLIELAAGDFILLPSSRDFVLASDCDIGDDEANLSACTTAEAFFGDSSQMPDFALLGGSFRFSHADTPLLQQVLPAFVHISAANGSARRLAHTIDLLADEAQERRPGRDLVLERLVEVMLIEALRNGADQPGTQFRPGLLAGLADPRINRALESFHADIAAAWTVASLAAQASLSRTAFSERFTRLVGVPPMTYVLEWRIAVAQDILLREHLPQEAVAAAVGYQSASAFSTAFRRKVGQAPGEYIRARQAT
ncbi:MAG: AraC family transcriptional regulator [Pigmentiphaga sp.]|uniref:AraC family transcriptional regulator n=1 Tax=Pigmentiphaga sp. TaxID=1977564 RepID=UPI0029BD4D7B|nr:AraC family transcriptional regulator [Pigmentiphaga sp.]MDX3905602.1 AraC family transcriptional regulator [Pigmentiphaga sp.]